MTFYEPSLKWVRGILHPLFLHCTQFVASNAFFYSYFVAKETMELSATPHRHGVKWPIICENLNFLKHNSLLHHHMFIQCYNLDPVGTNLKKKGMCEDDRCKTCGATEDLYHKLVKCKHKEAIWEKCKILYWRSTRCHYKDLNFNDVYRQPAYRFFPPTRRKFVIWLFAVTLFILKTKPDINTAEWYTHEVIFNFLSIPRERREAEFANYSRVLYWDMLVSFCLKRYSWTWSDTICFGKFILCFLWLFPFFFTTNS